MRIRILALAMVLLLPTAVLGQEGQEPGDLGGDLGGEEMGGEEMGGEVSLGGGDTAGADKPISLGLLLGYGISLEDINPWGFGFGVRGGYNLDQIFLGARFVYYLGQSESIPTGFGPTIEVDFNFWELGVEGGYDLAAGEGITVRPQLGIGLVGEDETEFYVAPGASVLFDVAENFFVGADARFQIVTSDPTAKAIILLANGGIRL